MTAPVRGQVSEEVVFQLLRTHLYTTSHRTDFQHVVDLGDIGSMGVGGPVFGPSGVDGFDDYAVSFGDSGPYGSANVVDEPWVEVYDGRTGELLLVLTNPTGPVLGSGWGTYLTAGLNVLNDSCPEIVIGMPGLFLIDIYDFSSATWQRYNDPNASSGYGFTIGLLGDVRGMKEAQFDDGYSEILVTNPAGGPLGTGIAYVLDVNDNLLANNVWRTVSPPAGDNLILYFGSGSAVIGDCWPQTGSDGTPEFAIGDYNYPGSGAYVIYSWDTATGQFLPLVDPTSGLPQQLWLGSQMSGHTGRWLAPAGDCDNNPDGGSASWDLISASGDEHGIFEFHVRARDLNQPASANLVSWGNEFTEPAAEPMHWWLFHRTPNAVGVGDTNLDGFDDILLVRGNECDSFDAIFEIYSGQSPFAASNRFWYKQYHNGKRLWGSPYNLIDPERPFTRNFVADLGDVNGDGIEDVGVITGIESTGDTSCVANPMPDRGMLLIYTPIPASLPSESPPVLPPYEPGIRGNLTAQVNRYVFIQVYNLMPGDTVWVYDAQDLQPPYDINGCGAPLEVYPNRTGPYTPNSAGEVTAILPIPIAVPTVHTPWYYQAFVQRNSPAACLASEPREVLIVGLSNPRWSLPR